MSIKRPWSNANRRTDHTFSTVNRNSINMKASITSVFALFSFSHIQALAAPVQNVRHDNLPTTNIAGVKVVWTPIVRDALEFAKENGDNMTYKHIVRTWLFGALEIANNTELSSVDLEVHAVASILHDLGWDETPGSKFISSNKRFEIDGAIGAREFIRAHPDGNKWDRRRLQLVFDGIALHGTPSISAWKEPEVNAVNLGVFHDVERPGPHIDPAAFARIVSEYPRDDIRLGLQNKVIWYCRTKPATTYGRCSWKDATMSVLTLFLDSWMQPFGERFVANYSAVGGRAIDIVTGPA